MIEAKDACCSLHAQHWNKWKGWLKRNELYWEVFWPGTMTAGSWKTWKCMICIFLFPFKCHLIFVVKSKVEVCFVNWSLQLFGCSWGLCAIFLEMILRCCQMRHDFYKVFCFFFLAWWWFWISAVPSKIIREEAIVTAFRILQGWKLDFGLSRTPLWLSFKSFYVLKLVLNRWGIAVWIEWLDLGHLWLCIPCRTEWLFTNMQLGIQDGGGAWEQLRKERLDRTTPSPAFGSQFCCPGFSSARPFSILNIAQFEKLGMMN